MFAEKTQQDSQNLRSNNLDFGNRAPISKKQDPNPVIFSIYPDKISPKKSKFVKKRLVPYIYMPRKGYISLFSLNPEKNDKKMGSGGRSVCSERTGLS